MEDLEFDFDDSDPLVLVRWDILTDDGVVAVLDNVVDKLARDWYGHVAKDDVRQEAVILIATGNKYDWLHETVAREPGDLGYLYTCLKNDLIDHYRTFLKHARNETPLPEDQE